MILQFEAPTAPVSINQLAGRHWAARERRLKPWRMAAYEVGKLVHSTRGEYTSKVVVTVSLPFTTNRRRDAHNYTGTVVKAIVDGLVASRLLVDDNDSWVEVADPVLRVTKDGLVTIQIKEV